MGMKVIRRSCPDCGQHRPFEKQGVNHVLHLILTVVTCGFWAIVWVVLIAMGVFRPYRCRECGKQAWL